MKYGASQVALVVKNPPANGEDMRHEFDPWVRRIPWRRTWQPTPVFLPGESRGQRSLVGYSPQGYKRVGHNLATEQQNAVHLKLKQYCKATTLIKKHAVPLVDEGSTCGDQLKGSTKALCRWT